MNYRNGPKKTLNVKLEIYDLQAVTQFLCDEDTFWIALEFLNVPADLFPRRTGNEWYDKLKDQFSEKEALVLNYAEFHELKRCINFATFHEKIDVPFWLQLLRRYPSIDEKSKLSRKVFYEICVASLRGLGTLDDCQEHLSSFFEQVSEISVWELESVQILFGYSVGAHARGLLHTPAIH